MRVDTEPSLRPADYPFTHRLRVRFAETDAMGIVHHSRYLPYLEEARVAYLRAIDHPYTEWRAAGLDSAVLEAYVRYRQPLRFDDEVDVHLGLASATRTTFQMAYLLTVAGGPAATARLAATAGPAATAPAVTATAVTVHGLVTAAGRPTRLPAWLVELGRGGAAEGHQ